MSSVEAPDFTDLSLFADGPPLELFARMRQECPVAWSPAPEHWPEWESRGYWSVTRAKDIAVVSRDYKQFSSHDKGFTLPGDAIAPLEMVQNFMIGKDPPEHTRMREIVSKVFTPWRVRELEGAIRAGMTRLIDAVIERGECDLVNDIAAPYAMEVIADLLAIPHEERPPLFHWTDQILAFDDAELSAGGSGEDAMNAAGAYLVGLIHQRLEKPGDDLVSALATATYRGEVMPEGERAALFIQLFAAGADTTRGTIALGMKAFIENPDQRTRVLEDPSLIPTAVEEVLRWAQVPMYMRRTARCDTEIAGQPIAKGDAVVLWLASASRDPEALPNPDTFDVGRTEVPHTAFGGGGRHFCMGAGLARLEIRIALEELLRRMPDMDFAGPPERVTANWVAGLKRMPIRFTPSTPEATS